MSEKLKWTSIELEVDRLKSNPKNEKFRKITERARNELEESVSELDYFKPLILDFDYTILGGNQRFGLATQKGVKKLWCSVPNRKLTKDERDKVILYDNTNKGSFDFEELQKQFEADLLKSLNLYKDLGDEDFNKYNNDNAVYPIVPKMSEKYRAFIIVADNEIDEAYMINKLGLQEKMKSYKTDRIKRSFVTTVSKFKKQLDGKN